MALSNLDKNTTTNLFRMLSLNDSDLSNIKSNYSSYGQLMIIAEQIYNLQKKYVRARHLKCDPSG